MIKFLIKFVVFLVCYLWLLYEAAGHYARADEVGDQLEEVQWELRHQDYLMAEHDWEQRRFEQLQRYQQILRDQSEERKEHLEYQQRMYGIRH